MALPLLSGSEIGSAEDSTPTIIVSATEASKAAWAGRIGSYLAQRQPSGVLELTDAERDLISQIKATDGERLAAIEVRHMRPDCTPREALITVLKLRGEDVFRTPTDHVLDENAARADGKPQTL
ncbi:hypothetical protein GQ649_29685 [Rhodococcus sp. DSM 6344]|nr:hypothetical protein [Rhodococcus erythropolis]